MKLRKKTTPTTSPQEVVCFGPLPEGAEFEFAFPNRGEKGVVWKKEGEFGKNRHGTLSQKIDPTTRVRTLKEKAIREEVPAGSWVVCNKCGKSVQLQPKSPSRKGACLMSSHMNLGHTPTTCSGAYTVDWSRETETQLQERLDREEELRNSLPLRRNRLKYVNRARELLQEAARSFDIQNFFGRDPVEVLQDIGKLALEASREIEKYAKSFEDPETRTVEGRGYRIIGSQTVHCLKCRVTFVLGKNPHETLDQHERQNESRHAEGV